jgi:uncharacterized protein YndB with AHSA1/START domain
MVDILHRIGTKAPLSKVYRAVSTVEGVAGWWTPDTSGSSQVGETIKVRFRSPAGEELDTMTFQVTALEPDKKVQWRCIEGPEEWVGTDVVFDLHRDGEYTILLFGHRNWREAVEFTHHCSTKWAVFMMSLKELVETGKGRPSPQEPKIDNWN